MTHHSRLAAVVVDAPPDRHERELAFWGGALGRALDPSEGHPEFRIARLGPTGFELLVQELGDGEPRVHLDFITDDLDAEVARLEGLGATRVRRVDRLWIMRDPAGLVFCVVETPSERFGDDDSTRWD
ncbi:MAG TPA: VOC family protein [Phytomonospora sp.]